MLSARLGNIVYTDASPAPSADVFSPKDMYLYFVTLVLIELTCIRLP